MGEPSDKWIRIFLAQERCHRPNNRCGEEEDCRADWNEKQPNHRANQAAPRHLTCHSVRVGAADRQNRRQQQKPDGQKDDDVPKGLPEDSLPRLHRHIARAFPVSEPDNCREQHSWQTENSQQMGGGGEDTFHC